MITYSQPFSLRSRLHSALPWLWCSTILAVSACQRTFPAVAVPVSDSNLSLRNEVQHAIDKGAAWLQHHQEPNGFWSTADEPAVTALALVALRGAAEHNATVSPEIIKKGYDYILGSVQPDGAIYRKPEVVTYSTSLCVMALLAANRAEYTPIILKARNFLIGLQIEGGRGPSEDVFAGGMGYGTSQSSKRPDLANTAQALEALYYSARLAKDQNLAGTKDLNWQAAISFIQNCQNLPEYNKQAWVSGDAQNRGGFVYYPGKSMAGETNLPTGKVALRSYGSISYAGLLSYIYADLKKDDPRVAAVLEWLQKNYTLDENPGMGQAGLYYYFQTMTKALTAAGVDSITTSDGRKVPWREALTLKLLNLQQQDGSWVNNINRWWEKDPALVTAYVLISLEGIKRNL